MEKPAPLCMHISLVSFHFTSLSAVLEIFSRGTFVLNFFLFSNIKCSI